MSDESAERVPGSELAGRYLVVRRLGAGAFGGVYEVQHRFTKHHRAMKVLHPLQAQNKDIVERFLREASAAGQIGSPHIVETFDAGHLEDGAPFIVMELLVGQTLDEFIRWNGRLEVGLACNIMRQACVGVHAAHRAKIVHRDLKPENLFVTTREGRSFIKVLDFGVSKFRTGEATDGRGTGVGMMVGTCAYASPEQLTDAKQVDARADVFSLGVVLYEIIAGTRPFEGSTLAATIQKVHHFHPPSLHDLDRRVPPSLAAIVERAMAKDAQKRFESAEALGEALGPFASKQGASMLLAGAASIPVARSAGGDTHRPGLVSETVERERATSPMTLPPVVPAAEAGQKPRSRWKLAVALVTTSAVLSAVIATLALEPRHGSDARSPATSKPAVDSGLELALAERRPEHTAAGPGDAGIVELAAQVEGNGIDAGRMAAAAPRVASKSRPDVSNTKDAVFRARRRQGQALRRC